MFPGAIHIRRDTVMGHLVVMPRLAPTVTDTGKVTVTTAGPAAGMVIIPAVVARITTDPVRW